MDVAIKSHREATAFLGDNLYMWSTVCVVNSDAPYVPKFIQTRSQGMLTLSFDDVDCYLKGFKMPSIKDVAMALEFAKGLPRLLVTCPNGLTRSAAIAYAAKCQASSPQEAIKVLDSDVYHPNRVVVEYAADLLQDMSVLNEFRAWHAGRAYAIQGSYQYM